LGPFREYTQAEILQGDCYKLGVDAPVRSSGELENAAPLKIIGPQGEITLNCGIIAHRHIHMKKDIADELGYVNGQSVNVRVPGIRGLIFENVLISIGGRGLMMHIDTEEGNAAGIKNGNTLELITE
jgi:putative phosphotransacetylase